MFHADYSELFSLLIADVFKASWLCFGDFVFLNHTIDPYYLVVLVICLQDPIHVKKMYV